MRPVGVHIYQWSTVLQGLNQTQPSLIQGKSPLNAPIVPLPSHRGVTSKSTCQHIQGRGVSFVTSATIHASKLLISRSTCCGILERNPLPAISGASLADSQTDWNITWFPTLVRNPLLARNANTHAGSPVISKLTKLTIPWECQWVTWTAFAILAMLLTLP